MIARPRSLLVALVVSVGVAVILVWIAYRVAESKPSPASGTLSYEFRLHLIQFLLVTALGAVAAFIVDAVKRRAEERARWREYEFDTADSLLERLETIYRVVKDTRQRMMLRRGNPPSDEEMWEIRDRQQDLEQLWKSAEVHAAAIGGDLSQMSVDVHYSMENYLGRIWDEWVTTSGTIGGELEKFATPEGHPGFNFGLFDTAYWTSRRRLIKLLVPKPVRSRVASDEPIEGSSGEERETPG